MEETHPCKNCGRQVVICIGSIGTRHQWIDSVACKSCAADTELLGALEHLLSRVAELGEGKQAVPLPIWNTLCIEAAMDRARAAIANHRPSHSTVPAAGGDGGR